MLSDLARAVGQRFETFRLALAERYSDRTVRQGPWLPLAMVEDPDDAAGLCGPPLTADRLAAIVTNFDVRTYAPPIIAGKDGPAHWQGEYLDPLGHVAEVEFDGLTLWGRAAEICDYGESRVEGAVSTGRFKRSIRFGYGDAPEATVLLHLALSGGEVEGQIGLVPLTHAYPAALTRQEDPTDADPADELPAAMADRFGSLHVGERTFPAPKAPRSEDPMDDTKLQEMFTGLRTGISADISTAVTAAVDPLKAELAEVKAGLATATATADRTAADGRRAGYRTALDSLVREGRMMPAELDGQLNGLMALPPEGAEGLMAGLRTRPPMLGRFTSAPLTVGEGAAAVPVADLMMGDPVLDPSEISPAQAERFSEVIAAAGGPEGAKNFDALMRAARASGHPLDGARSIAN